MSDNLFADINEIPGSDGWWLKSCGETYAETAKQLQLYGIPDDVILTMLQGLYDATAEEFGS